MKLSKAQAVALALLAIAWVVRSADSVPTVPPDTPVEVKTDLAAVVYESEEMSLAPYVIGAANEIGASGIEVRLIDDDVTTGNDNQPAQVKLAIEAARANGLPALVVMGGGKVLRVVDLPTSKEAIVGAVR